MKTLLLTALLFGAPVAASAQDYDALADVNMIASTAPASTRRVDAAVLADRAVIAAHPRAVRVAASPRSLTVALARKADHIVMASASIGG